MQVDNDNDSDNDASPGAGLWTPLRNLPCQFIQPVLMYKVNV